MKKKMNTEYLSVWLVTGSLLLLGGGSLGMWLASGYGPLLALALLQLMGGIVNLLLLLPLGKARQMAELPAVPEGKKKRPFFKSLAVRLANILRKLANFWHKRRDVLLTLLLIAAIFGANYFFWPNLSAPNSGKLAYWIPVVLALCFVISVALEKLCAHIAAGEETTPRWAAVAGNVKGVLLLSRIALVLTAAAMVLKLTNLYDPYMILQICLLVLFLYETVLLVLSVAIRLIRKELGTNPELPLSFRAMGNTGVLAYLEENTGITMRSLWSIRLVRQLLPAMALFVLLLTWLFSGVTQIEAHQEGALYRLGKLQKETLKPGIHLTLPWPVDKVEVYDTQSLRRVVVGYIPNGKNDNTWTENHGTEEYRLLLGGGNEMVSINLQVEYMIKDLSQYLRSAASADNLLSAAAYEIVTARTIATDIDTLLSTDRTVFSETFQQELEGRMEAHDLGIHVTDVVLESIHPPVEVASVYQEVISAGIRAEQLQLSAQQQAVLEVTEAKLDASAKVGVSTMIMHQDIAAAKGAVSGFMAAVEAYGKHPAAYRYYKYLSALTDAYTKSVLVLVGDGVDESKLVIGNISRVEYEDPYYIEDEVEEEYWQEEE